MDMPAPATASPPPASASNRRWLTVILAFWLLLIVGLLWYAWRLPQQWFDPQQVQPHAFNDPAQVQRFVTALSHLKPDLNMGSPWFVRFRQADCRCEHLVDAYHQLQTSLLQRQEYQVVTLERDDITRLAQTELPELMQWISSTPAVLVLDRQGRLAYFGPYHQEGICNSENSYLEPVLQAVEEGRPVNIINTLVFGCFCSTTSSIPPA